MPGFGAEIKVPFPGIFLHFCGSEGSRARGQPAPNHGTHQSLVETLSEVQCRCLRSVRHHAVIPVASQKYAGDPRPHIQGKIMNKTSGQKITSNASKQGKFGSLGAIFLFIFFASYVGVGVAKLSSRSPRTVVPVTLQVSLPPC